MMMTTKTRLMGLLLALLALSVGACAEESGPAVGDLPVAEPGDSDAPLSNLDALLDGAPDNDKLPSEAKADQVFPPTFDVVASQSPVKSQGSRGVCSIFSTTALMEHLYIKEGTIKVPDFSEQFLQWSVKEEVGDFKETDGSNANSNLAAINRFGIVDEISWPYQSSPWTAANDPGCGAEKEEQRPTACFTNGAPPESAKAARRFNLPRGRFVSSRVPSVKAIIQGKQTAVVAGMTFFYQSWNHRKSTLPVNSTYWSEGYVLAPNAKDRELSLAKRAGHSILLVGWDDNLEVPLVDEKGEVVKDAQGNAVKEKGFFLFKNSWGTAGFGIRNPHGAGYGWIAYRYIEEFASSTTADVPRLNLGPEVCDDGKDNNDDRQSDCDDPKCSSHAACVPQPVGGELSNRTPFEIPDNDPNGVTSTIEVGEEGFVLTGAVDVDIEHPFIGDLTVTLVSPSGAAIVLHNKTGESDDNLKASFEPASLVGQSVKGTWSLKVVDTANQDKGTLKGWSLTFDLTNEPTEGGELHGEASPGVAIPDNDRAGVTSKVALSGSGVIDKVTVNVDINHPFIGDLTVTLVSPSGVEVVLHKEAGGGADNLVKAFTVSDLAGASATGDWTLRVVDNAQSDAGTLNRWSLDVTVR